MQRTTRILGLIGLVASVGAMSPCHGATATPPEVVNGYSVGEYAFDFPALDLSGTDVTLYKYAGNYIVLDFCAQWCTPCRQLTPVLDQMSGTFNSTGLPETTLDFLLQDIQGTPSTVRSAQQWASAFHLSMPVLSVGGAANSVGFSQMLNYSLAAGQPEGGYPTIVVLSPTLKILSEMVGTPMGPDQLPMFVNQIIQADLIADPSSGLAEAAVLTQRRSTATEPFPLNARAGEDILDALGRIQRNVTLERTEVACAQTEELIAGTNTATCSASGSKACPSGIKVLDPAYGAQLRTLLGDVRTALHCSVSGDED
jgi:thiol-disulfide isomerase/thioredoxin